MFIDNLLKRYSDEKQLRMIADYCHDHKEFLKTHRRKEKDLSEFTWGMISGYEDIEVFCRCELGELSMYPKNKGDFE
ncbi:hypothetical protein [Anaerotignum propionicum]|uniref:hypothetical protein n=1 Tax=Anaerotignum propionicum TaxID=28446 RepID=UPI0028A01E07|nr:hypothetical protein [Anaerotignum propionicum]